MGPWLLLMALSLLAATGAGASEAPQHLREVELASISLSDLQDPTAQTYEIVAQALAQVGLFAVTLPDNGEDTASRALRGFAGCSASVANGAAAADLRVSDLDDGSKRTSLAVQVQKGELAPLPSSVSGACPHFSTSSLALRHAVDETGRAFADVLDSILDSMGPQLGGPEQSAESKPERQTGAPGLQNGDTDSQPARQSYGPGPYRWAVEQAESLEHFHVYQKQAPGEAQNASTAALTMHTDLGLFLVMAPAVQLYQDTFSRVAGSSAGMGLRLRLPTGEIVSQRTPANSLVVMLGEGATKWMVKPPALTLYAPPHEVVVSEVPGTVRSWYGRMFFPMPTATLAGGSLTWQEYRNSTMKAFARSAPSEASTAGCQEGTGRLALSDEKTCAHGEMYCWMTCMSLDPIEGECAPEEAVCVDAQGHNWPEEFLDPDGKPTHCMSCGVQCPAVPRPDPEPASICTNNLTATVMWMTGFQHLEIGHGQPCIAFLFDWFILDTRLKFAAGVVATLAMGLLVEFIVYARRKMLAHPHRFMTAQKQFAFYVFTIAVYGVQVTLGYLLMLVAMTYQYELFIAVVVGLLAGHAVFNAKGPVLDSADACCMGLDPWTARADDDMSSLQQRLAGTEEEELADALLHCHQHGHSDEC